MEKRSRIILTMTEEIKIKVTNIGLAFKILAFGGGVDSSALLAIHLERDKAAAYLGITREELDKAFPRLHAVVFSDPGSEWPETYENIEYARKRCEEDDSFTFNVVRHHYNRYFHKETNKALRQKEWRLLPETEQDNYEKRSEPYTIFEWLTDSAAFPLMPGGGHVCSMRFKGDVMQKWADEQFGTHDVSTKHWYLGIEAEEEGRSQRFTANHKGNVVPGHVYHYPLMDLKLNRKECLEILDHLGWDYRGDGSPVQKSSCMWCPFSKEWEIDRLVASAMSGDNTKGITEALEIERRFYETDKHAKWHEAGMPLNKGGRCNAGHHRQPYATGYCSHEGCSDHNKHGQATLIQLRYPNNGSQPHAKGKVRKTIRQHIARFVKENS